VCLHITRMSAWVCLFAVTCVDTLPGVVRKKALSLFKTAIYRHKLARYKSRHMTHSYYMTWNDSFIVCDVTYSYICHVALMYVTWFIVVIWNDAFLYMTWLLHTYDMTHGCIRHDSIRYMTWRIHVREVTHSQWKTSQNVWPRINSIWKKCAASQIFYETKCAAGKIYQTKCAAGQNFWWSLMGTLSYLYSL